MEFANIGDLQIRFFFLTRGIALFVCPPSVLLSLSTFQVLSLLGHGEQCPWCVLCIISCCSVTKASLTFVWGRQVHRDIYTWVVVY